MLAGAGAGGAGVWAVGGQYRRCLGQERVLAGGRRRLAVQK